MQGIFVGDEYHTADIVPLRPMQRQHNRDSTVEEAQDENERHL
jgi:hypothetical protein